MKEQTNLSGDAMMRSRLRMKLGNPAGRKYERQKKVYYIFAIYSFLLFAVHEIMFGIMLLPQGYFIGASNEQAFFHSNFFVVQGMIVTAVFAFVMMLLKKDLIACCSQTVSGVLLIINLIQIATGEYNNKSYMFVAYAVIIIAVLMAVLMLSVLLNQRRRLEKAVAKEYDKIYKKYGDEEGTLFTEEQLETILVAYETALAKGEAAPHSIDF